MKFKYKIILLPAILLMTLCMSFLSGCSSGAQVQNYSEDVANIFEPLKESFNNLDEKRSDLAKGELSKTEADQLIIDMKKEVADARTSFNALKTPKEASEEHEKLTSAFDSFDKGLVLLQDASNAKIKIRRSNLIRKADNEISRGFKAYDNAIADLNIKDD